VHTNPVGFVSVICRPTSSKEMNCQYYKHKTWQCYSYFLRDWGSQNVFFVQAGFRFRVEIHPSQFTVFVELQTVNFKQVFCDHIINVFVQLFHDIRTDMLYAFWFHQFRPLSVFCKCVSLAKDYQKSYNLRKDSLLGYQSVLMMFWFTNEFNLVTYNLNEL